MNPVERREVAFELLTEMLEGLNRLGLSDAEIGKRIGRPANTVRRWRVRDYMPKLDDVIGLEDVAEGVVEEYRRRGAL